MMISDFIFQFRVAGYRTSYDICRIRLFVSLPERVVALLTDLGEESLGHSVTNEVEKIRTQLAAKGFIPTDASIVEHHEASTSGPATFDHVTFDSKGHPNWRPMTFEEAQVFIGCSEEMLRNSVHENQRLLTEIAQTRHAIDPRIDLPHPGSASVIARQMEIEQGMLPRLAIQSLIDGGAGERALQEILKRDLSILGEMYANPCNEYVCFAEFPIGEGVVDFAVFSGRSRMDVILIEVKGADFFLINRDTYAGFSHKVNQAADQIRQRLGHACRHLETFRSSVHHVLQTVESGKSIHHSFPGPQDRLQVDPDKDINLRAVVIGGRTRDDLEESHKRHEYESHFVPRISIESWDTWIRKLRRL
jgi:Domain of unknown function (DUF4263)